jgi:hypothetical protein
MAHNVSHMVRRSRARGRAEEAGLDEVAVHVVAVAEHAHVVLRELGRGLEVVHPHGREDDPVLRGRMRCEDGAEKVEPFIERVDGLRVAVSAPVGVVAEISQLHA